MKNILAFETSCDDTAVAIVNEDGIILGDAIFSQTEHEVFLGVVPEVGSRAHIEQILRVTKEVFLKANLKPSDIDAVAATFAPGLVGPLLVGAQFAKGFAQALSLPLIPVHHIAGHIFAGFKDENFPRLPFVALIASGGHTALYVCDADYAIKQIGRTLDDAAGEAFDKVGRALGLGYPAGKKISDLAQEGNPKRFSFPIALKNQKSLDFSFSGLKTKVLNTIAKNAPLSHSDVADICAGLEEAIAEALTKRAIKAVHDTGIVSLLIGGGVSANRRLREMLEARCKELAIHLYLPKNHLCTDNAVMIAKAAHINLKKNYVGSGFCDVFATLPVEQAWQLHQVP